MLYTAKLLVIVGLACLALALTFGDPLRDRLPLRKDDGRRAHDGRCPPAVGVWYAIPLGRYLAER